ncbi:MAG: hypothetical protein J6B88_04995 [Clostridia bacterium]|nr:hypothetical protein [Clostridia bacterium]
MRKSTPSKFCDLKYAEFLVALACDDGGEAVACRHQQSEKRRNNAISGVFRYSSSALRPPSIKIRRLVFQKSIIEKNADLNNEEIDCKGNTA